VPPALPQADAEPVLHSIGPDPAPAAPPRVEDAPERGGAGRALLVLALVVALALLCWQSLRANGLAEEVTALQQALSVAEEDVRQHEQRIGVVRSHVDDLSARIGALRTLVADEIPSRRKAAAE